MNDSDRQSNPDQTAEADSPGHEPRYRAGRESVRVTPHQTPGDDTYGPESGEIETVERTPADVAGDPGNSKQRTGERQAAVNREDDPPA